MEPITTFLTTTIIGQIIIGATGESVNALTLGKVENFWDELNLGNHDLQNAITEAYEYTIGSIEIALTPKEGLKGLLSSIIPKKKREKELAEDFTQKILTPFLQKNRLEGISKDKFLQASKKSCQYLLKQKDKIFNFEELINDLKQKDSETSRLINKEARETFHLIEAILFVGQDLSDAPDINKSKRDAQDVIFKRIENSGRDEIGNFFMAVNLPPILFYDLLKEQDLFLNGLVFNLDLAIKNNQKVANILQEYRSQERKIDREKEKQEQEKEQNELKDKITKIEQAIDLMKQAGMDTSPMKGQLEPLQKELGKIDSLIKKSEKWSEIQKNIEIHMSTYKESFGDIMEAMEELGDKMDELLSEVRKIDKTLTDVADTTKEVKTVTVETRNKVTDVDKKVDFIIELLQGFNRDTTLGDNQRESLIAGLDPQADFDLHFMYDFEEKTEYELGRGAVGIVYKAIHRGTKEPCALKLLKKEYRNNHTIVSRFLREGTILKSLKHPNIVSVEEAGGGGKDLNFYIHMELLKGLSFRKLMDEKKVPRDWDRLLSITQELCNGLSIIHKNGIIHRDINPNNIMLTEKGTVKLMDFGVAKIVGLSGLTRHGDVVGTSKYMSPEQEKGESLDYRTDIYSLGLVLYELYTYRSPEKPPRSVRFYNPNIPEWVDLIIQKCLIPEKEHRYNSIDKMQKSFEGKGADPKDIKKYKNQLYVVLEDGKITKREEALLAELRLELNLSDNLCMELEKEVRKELLEEKLKEGKEALSKGNIEITEEEFTTVLLLDPNNKEAQEGLAKIKNSNSRQVSGKIITEIKPVINQPVIQKETQIITPKITQPLDIRKEENISTDAPKWEKWKEIRKLGSADGHRNSVNGVAITSDNRYIISGSDDQSICIWDRSGKEIRKIKKWIMMVKGLKLTADEKYVLVAGCSTNSLHLFDIETGQEVRTFKGPQPQWSIDLSEDNKYAVSACSDKAIYLWDFTTGEIIRKFEGHTALPAVSIISSDNKYIISSGQDKIIKVWEPGTGSLVADFTGHTSSVTSLALTPDLKYLISADQSGIIFIWSFPDGQIINRIQGCMGCIRSICLCPGKSTFLTGGNDGKIKLWDIEKGIEIKDFEGHVKPVTSLCISKDRSYMVSGGQDGTVKLWDLYNGIELWNFEGHSMLVNHVTLTEDCKNIISGSHDSLNIVWDMETGQSIRKIIYSNNYVYKNLLTEDKKYLLTIGTGGGVFVFDFHTGEKLKGLYGSNGFGLGITSDNKQVITAAYGNKIIVIDYESAKTVKTFEGHTGDLRDVVITKDNKYIISGALDKTVRIWDFETGKELKKLEGHTAGVLCLAVSDSYIVSGGTDNIIILWDFHGGKIRIFAGHTGWVNSVYISRDNKYIVSSGGDGTVRVWDVLSGKSLKMLHGHEGKVMSAVLSTDNKYIISGGEDKTVRIWGEI